MKIKHLLLLFLFSLPMIFSTAARSWSVADSLETYFAPEMQCYSVIAGNEEETDEANNEEEEEPDCE